MGAVTEALGAIGVGMPPGTTVDIVPWFPLLAITLVQPYDWPSFVVGEPFGGVQHRGCGFCSLHDCERSVCPFSLTTHISSVIVQSRLHIASMPRACEWGPSFCFLFREFGNEGLIVCPHAFAGRGIGGACHIILIDFNWRCISMGGGCALNPGRIHMCVQYSPFPFLRIVIICTKL